MKSFSLSTTVVAASLLIAQTAFAAPAYEHHIDLRGLQDTKPVLISVPEDVLAITTINDLRVLQGSTVVPLKSAPERRAELKNMIYLGKLCSVEGIGSPNAFLTDGDPATSMRPDPLKNPTSCTFTFSFVRPVRVDAIDISASEAITKLTVSAQSNGTFVKLGQAANTHAMRFSSVMTDELQITIEYSVVPELSDISISGIEPARLLFTANPDVAYRLVYGDSAPSTLPAASASLVATADTPYAVLGSRKTIGEAPTTAATDTDRDGIADGKDNCPTHFNPNQRDSDINGTGDVCDDSDADNALDGIDNCPGIANPDQRDSDGDGAGDACQLDRDGDLIPDATDVCRSVRNTAQEDSDGDGIGDACDSCPSVRNPGQEDRNSNTLGDACEGATLDADNDSIVNDADNCGAVANKNQLDQDRDTLGDACDNCPTIQNVDQTDSNRDGQGDACTDIDRDGLLPPIDNCESEPNADQLDKNNDGIGDACEDDDNDGIANGRDNCRYASNGNQGDLDADGMGDACDTEDGRLSEQHPWVLWIGMTLIVGVLLALVVRMVLKIKKEGGIQ